MALTREDVRIIKGMLKRGDAQQWIVAWFGGEHNQARVADIKSGKTWPEVETAQEAELPPPGPYMGARSAARALQTLEALKELSAGPLDALKAFDALIDGAIQDIRKWEDLSNDH